jgi:hypothetical protein
MHGYIDEMKTAVDENYQNRLSEYAAKYDVAQNYSQAHPFDEERD